MMIDQQKLLKFVFVSRKFACNFDFKVDNLAITIKGNDDDDVGNELPKKKKKINRREKDKEFFIPYQPPDFKRERGYIDKT